MRRSGVQIPEAAPRSLTRGHHIRGHDYLVRRRDVVHEVCSEDERKTDGSACAVRNAGSTSEEWATNCLDLGDYCRAPVNSGCTEWGGLIRI